MTIKKLKSIDIINVLSDLVSKKLETTVKLPELMAHLSNRIAEDGYDCKILAASFKGVQQVRDAFNAGSQAITAPVSVLKAIFENPSISKAVTDFNNDWYSVYGEDKGLCDM